MPIPTSSVEVVMLGIQAAMRINAQFRRAYADSTRSRALTLPLPSFPGEVDATTAESYFRHGAGRRFVGDKRELQAILDQIAAKGLPSLSAEQRKRLMEEYLNCSRLTDAEAGRLITDSTANPAGLTNDDLACLLSIRQWREGEGPRSMLQQMAGELINIAVDYLPDVPGLISTTSNQGKALRGFLQAMDEINFAEDSGGNIVNSLFLGVVQTIRDYPALLSSEQRLQELFQGVGSSLYARSKAWFDKPGNTLLDQDRVLSWSETVVSSVLRGAGDVVFAQPARYLGVKGGGPAELISAVGTQFLDAILTSDDRVNLAPLLSARGLDALTKTALRVVGDYPDLVAGGNEHLRSLVQDTAHAIADSARIIGPDIIPEAIRLVLESLGRQLPQLAGAGLPGSPHAVLVGVTQEFLEILATPPAQNGWAPKFAATDAKRLLEVALDQVVRNPGWLQCQAGERNSLLGKVTRSVLATLSAIPAAQRLSTQTTQAILESALLAVGQRLELYTVAGNKPPVCAVIDAVLHAAFKTPDAQVTWVLAREESIKMAINLAFAALARWGPTDINVGKVPAVLDAVIAKLKKGDGWSLDQFEEMLSFAFSTSAVAAAGGRPL